ncbi:Uncharacterized protein Fot_04787 [Forsythia ovata]|uniref:Uncharacterized protein n=1 Tax=Forsythia ovata TaxID=205694 RepID=A0ABD1XGP2_9LAMI
MIVPLPYKFKVPTDEFDGTTDPIDHICTFQDRVRLHEWPDTIACREFPMTLRKDDTSTIDYLILRLRKQICEKTKNEEFGAEDEELGDEDEETGAEDEELGDEDEESRDENEEYRPTKETKTDKLGLQDKAALPSWSVRARLQ